VRFLCRKEIYGAETTMCAKPSGGRILVSTLLAVIVTAAAGTQSAPAVSSAEARKAIQAGYVEWDKARVAMDKNTIERMLDSE